MDSRIIGVVVGLGLVGCGSVDDSWQRQPADPFVVSVAPPAFPGGSSDVGPGGMPWTLGTVNVEGHLEGRLHVVELSGDTTNNAGDFQLGDDGSGYLNVTIAADGDGGAGMLIVNIGSPAIDTALSIGQWSTLDRERGAAFVNSCAGPVMGQWETELPAVDFEMTAEEDPEQPEITVVRVRARFPLNAEYVPAPSLPGSPGPFPTSELRGWFSFARFTQP